MDIDYFRKQISAEVMRLDEKYQRIKRAKFPEVTVVAPPCQAI